MATAGLGFAASDTELCGVVMVTLTGKEIATSNTESPKYCPVMLWMPICRVDVVNDDDPFTTGAEPKENPLSTKCTLPVAFAAAPFITDRIAVRVRGLA